MGLTVDNDTSKGNGEIKGENDSHAQVEFIQMAFKRIEKKAQRSKLHFMEDMNSQMSRMMDDIFNEFKNVDKTQHNCSPNFSKEDIYVNRKPKESGILSEKHFYNRRSLLTELFENKHISNIYNISVAILITLFLRSVSVEWAATGRFNLGIEFVVWSFSGLPEISVLWFAMMAELLLVFLCFNTWAKTRLNLKENSLNQKIWDYGWISAFILWEIKFLCVPSIILLKLDLSPVSNFAISMEQIRMIMKGHAFVRSNCKEFLHFSRKSKSNDNLGSLLPGFSSYIYYLFAPTFVYKHSYPRTKYIDWNYVGYRFLEVIGITFYISYLFQHCIQPMYEEFGLRPYSLKELVVAMFNSIMPAMCMFLCIFYLVLHAWLNAFSEMLRFGDRMFYKDWWNSTTFSSYYRTWNIVVHDWLYAYIYKDFIEYFKLKNKTIPTLLVFLISAIIHEQILIVTFKCFFPVLLILFGVFGVGLVFLITKDSHFGNIIFWVCLLLGNGLLIELYSIEFFSRRNCPQLFDDTWDFFLPRSLYCNPPVQ